jgi:hypothetical protein
MLLLRLICLLLLVLLKIEAVLERWWRREARHAGRGLRKGRERGTSWEAAAEVERYVG